MKLLVFLATVVLVSARSVKIDQIEYGFCPDSPEPGTIDNIDVQPFPISLVTGSSLTIAATLTLNEAVPTGATVSLDLKKEGLIPLPIPCLEIPDSETGEILHIGSCTYNADDLLARFADFLCPAHVPDGQSCSLPLNPGTYGGDPPIEVMIPDIPDILAELVGAGTYYLGASVNLEDGSLMACLYVRVEVTA